jgi:hypothetical protein
MAEIGKRTELHHNLCRGKSSENCIRKDFSFDTNLHSEKKQKNQTLRCWKLKNPNSNIFR